jgi:hypothetical protein
MPVSLISLFSHTSRKSISVTYEVSSAGNTISSKALTDLQTKLPKLAIKI